MFGLEPATVEMVQRGAMAVLVLLLPAFAYVVKWLRDEINGRRHDNEKWANKFAEIVVDSTKGDLELAGAVHSVSNVIGTVQTTLQGQQSALLQAIADRSSQ